MASLKKRKNKWFASFVFAGKTVVKTTGIDVSPVHLTGKYKIDAEKENRALALIVANELERAAYGEKIDREKLALIIGKDKATKLLTKNNLQTGTKDYLNKWLMNRRPETIPDTRVSINRFLKFLGPKAENIPLDHITRDMAERFMYLELERVASKTVDFYLTYLSVAFKAAVNSGIIDKNPFSGIHPPKQNRHDHQDRQAFTLDEVRFLINTLPGEWPDMIRLCLYTGGQRLGDVATIRWSQIDLDHGIISMTTQKTKRRMNKPIITPLKTLLEKRLSTRCSDYVFPIAAMRHAQAGHKSSKLSIDFVALLRKHGIIEPPTKKHGDRRHLAEKSFHSLRATAVTVLRNAGVPPDLCRAIVGHDSEEIERIYYRPDPATIAAAMQNLHLDPI